MTSVILITMKVLLKDNNSFRKYQGFGVIGNRDLAVALSLRTALFRPGGPGVLTDEGLGFKV